MEASKKKEQQLQTQLDTAQHKYQDKERQCSKLEQELHVMEKRIAVVTDKLEQCMISYTHTYLESTLMYVYVKCELFSLCL